MCWQWQQVGSWAAAWSTHAGPGMQRGIARTAQAAKAPWSYSCRPGRSHFVRAQSNKMHAQAAHLHRHRACWASCLPARPAPRGPPSSSSACRLQCVKQEASLLSWAAPGGQLGGDGAHSWAGKVHCRSAGGDQVDRVHAPSGGLCPHRSPEGVTNSELFSEPFLFPFLGPTASSTLPPMAFQRSSSSAEAMLVANDISSSTATAAPQTSLHCLLHQPLGLGDLSTCV